MLDRRSGLGQVARLICESCKFPLLSLHEFESEQWSKELSKKGIPHMALTLEGISFCQCPELAILGGLELK